MFNFAVLYKAKLIELISKVKIGYRASLKGDHVNSSKKLGIFEDLFYEESEKSLINKNDFCHDLSIMKQKRNLRKICG